ncbi:MAG: tRNA (adenosine(37)-N6)-dimethylallyltransferase MiaA [Clostridia bacterium]|nr:tRNA (adenosine(37)-N6)-dimethylallyltransferase MiaA [Clostridia bacterium]
MNKIPIIVVAGPTASGKTSLGIAVCKKFSGEVISADSMQIYKGMNIATAKPTKEETDGIPHHLIDVIDPEERFSVAEFKRLAEEKISDIVSRGKLPVIVGGTGLYIDNLVENIELADSEVDLELREKLTQKAKKEGIEVLIEELKTIDPEYVQGLKEINKKRIIRALELWYTSGITVTEQNRRSRLNGSPYRVCYLCLDAHDREILYNRINIRVDKMVEDGLLQEAEQFRQSKGITSAQAIGYKELDPYFNGEKTLQKALDSLKQGTRRYAKRQLTWFRRNENAIHLYIDEYESSEALCKTAFDIIENFLKEE